MTGKFIVFEGLDGSGKTIQSIHVEKRLKEKGIDVVRVIDPGGTEVGDILRDIVKTKDISNMASLMLFMTSRYELYHNVIKPALDAGKWVISDRFYYSTYVYQGIYQGLEKEFAILKKMMFENIKIDHVFYLDVTPAVSEQRINNRQDMALKDNYDNINLSKKEKMREAYLDLFYTDPSFIYIPADNDEEKVKKDIGGYMTLILNGISDYYLQKTRNWLHSVPLITVKSEYRKNAKN